MSNFLTLPQFKKFPKIINFSGHCSDLCDPLIYTIIKLTFSLGSSGNTPFLHSSMNSNKKIMYKDRNWLKTITLYLRVSEKTKLLN